MIIVILLALIVHVRFHPYSDRTANACANLSLCTLVIVGIVNICSAAVDYSGGNFQYGDAPKIGQTLVTLENILVDVFPISVVIFCVGYFLYVNLSNKLD